MGGGGGGDGESYYSSADEEIKTTESMDGRGGSISLEEETTRMALLLGSISKGGKSYY